MLKFKSLKPVHVKHERGEDFVQIEGEVIKIEGNRVFLKGLMYDFSISLSDFNTRNILKTKLPTRN